MDQVNCPFTWQRSLGISLWVFLALPCLLACSSGFQVNETDLASFSSHTEMNRSTSPSYDGTVITCSNLSGTPTQLAAAIQSCFDSAPSYGSVALPSGTYQISNILTINKPIRVFTQGLTNDSPICGANSDRHCTVIQAVSPMGGINAGFFVVQSPDVTLDHIVVDGNKAQRSSGPEGVACANGTNSPGMNIFATGGTLSLIGITSQNALCGSGAVVTGDGLLVTGSSFLSNGVHNVHNMWSDGLTVSSTANANVTGNYFSDNTDVNLIFGACPNCNISSNTITHSGSFAGSSFAGLMLQAWPNGTSGIYSGSIISNNQINCANYRCGFGMMIGALPWYAAPMEGGLVVNNQITGAQVGILINNATNPSNPVQIGPNGVSNSGGGFLSSAGPRSVPALGMASASNSAVQFVQGAKSTDFGSVDLTGAVMNWWTQDVVAAPAATAAAPAPAAAPPAAATTTSSNIASLPASIWMNAGTSFSANQGVRSSTGSYALVMQSDGNLVFYGPSGPIWSTGTSGSGATVATMQSDGNLVLYTAQGSAVWNSQTGGWNGSKLAVQDDGNLVIYNSAGAPIWNYNGLITVPTAPVAPALTSSTISTTSQSTTWLNAGSQLNTGQSVSSDNGAYTLVMQVDGNFVLYGPTGVVWSTGTSGSGATHASMQTDGNLVLYTANGQPVWYSGTNAFAGANLAVQDDGNLVIYAPGEYPVWEIL